MQYLKFPSPWRISVWDIGDNVVLLVTFRPSMSDYRRVISWYPGLCSIELLLSKPDTTNGITYGSYWNLSEEKVKLVEEIVTGEYLGEIENDLSWPKLVKETNELINTRKTTNV